MTPLLRFVINFVIAVVIGWLVYVILDSIDWMKEPFISIFAILGGLGAFFSDLAYRIFKDV